jgi:hypothetical protein
MVVMGESPFARVLRLIAARAAAKQRRALAEAPAATKNRAAKKAPG